MWPGIFSVIVLLCFFQSLDASSTDSKLKLSIDHDGGADDAMAIIMSLLNEKHFDGPEVVALTVTYGNVNLTQAVNNSARILKVVDRLDVPIYAGASQPLISGEESNYFFGNDGLGDTGYVPTHPVNVEKQHAAIALIELSKKFEGKLVVMALGPLTNIALAIRLDPDFINRLAQLYVGGGNIIGNDPGPQFNTAMDPESYYVVTNISKLEKVTFIPSSQIQISLNISKEWRRDVLGAIQTPVVQTLNEFDRVAFAKATTNWIETDPAEAAMVLKPGVIQEIKNANSSIILCGDHRALTPYDFTATEPNSRVVYSANQDIYKQFLIDVLSADVTRNKTTY